jgi:hypothetical protein
MLLETWFGKTTKTEAGSLLEWIWLKSKSLYSKKEQSKEDNMSKTLISQPIGGDGAKAELKIESGNLVAEISYPLTKLLDPVNAIIDSAVSKIEALIPGQLDNALLEPIKAAAKAELAALLSEV